MSCRATREWLHRETTTLDEAQRLRLDDHLASCGECRDDRARLRSLREVGAALPVPAASSPIYNRAIARALLGPRNEPAPARRPLWLIPLAIGVAAAAIAIVVITRDDEPAKHDVVAPLPEPPKPHEAPKPPPSDIVVEPIRVATAKGTKLSRTGNTFILEQGRVEIEASSEVRIITERFEVELTDARVAVEPTVVHVHRGTARVVDRSRVQLALLEAGAEWRPAEPKQVPKISPEPAADVLARARTKLAAGHHGDAERIVDALLARSLSRRDEAEARMFLADVAQAGGNLDVAVARYDGVATKFADLPAAESALYAAARIEARRGRTDAARALFDRYLARYPTGRYADDVRQKRRP